MEILLPMVAFFMVLSASILSVFYSQKLIVYCAGRFGIGHALTILASCFSVCLSLFWILLVFSSSN